MISIIVPVYNVEKYLSCCIDSIINQTYKNLEVILVDDGSSDNCGTICDEYDLKDSRIKVIHKENGGVSSARNVGLDVCTGEYILFIDSDDYIENNMCEVLLNNLKQYNADISICMFSDIWNSNYNKSIIQDTNLIVVDRERVIKNILYNSSVGMCNKLFKSSLLFGELGNIDLYFNKNIINNEDALFLFQLISKSNKIVFDNTIFYYYCHREGSASSVVSISNKRLMSIYQVFCSIYEALKDKVSNNALDLVIAYYNKIIIIEISIFYAYSKSKIENHEIFNLVKFNKTYYCNYEDPIYKKIRVFINYIMIKFHLPRFLFKIFYKCIEIVKKIIRK